MKVEIWSDVVCPWCYIGKRRFEAALARFEHRDEVEVVWRSYELDPSAPPERTGGLVEHLAAKYHVSREQAASMHDRVQQAAESVGVDYRVDIARPGNTFDAHRLIHLGTDRGLGDQVKEAMLAAYQSQGEPIGDHEALVRIAVGAGLDDAEVRDVLGSDRYADAVRRDEWEASDLGVQGVPFFVVDRRYGISGAQPDELFLQALERAWAERQPKLEALVPDGATPVVGDACGPDGC
jgi:predicted DsbA family dithiol-disulfide isomerase